MSDDETAVNPRPATSHPVRARPATTPTAANSVQALFSHGRLTAIPRRPARRQQLLVHLAQTLFEPARTYTEREVNEALHAVHDDSAALRRHLITAGLLTRTPDGAAYWRSAQAA